MAEIANIQHPVILFDGICNLCNNAVQFVIKRDKKSLFRFSSLQSSFGQNLLNQHNLHHAGFDSFILLENGKIYTKSTAALMVAKRLSGAWALLYCFIIIPPFIRNSVYDIIARNRYKWFGKKESCWLPSPELKIRFFD
jgi:predicted DCC family thiol-disulfide oxidoreductase YuxK